MILSLFLLFHDHWLPNCLNLTNFSTHRSSQALIFWKQTPSSHQVANALSVVNGCVYFCHPSAFLKCLLGAPQSPETLGIHLWGRATSGQEEITLTLFFWIFSYSWISTALCLKKTLECVFHKWNWSQQELLLLVSKPAVLSRADIVPQWQES